MTNSQFHQYKRKTKTMAGGQATNSGIDYQQRVAAWFLINQFTSFDISNYFDQLDDELIINKVFFETNNPIDDLKLECFNSKKIFLQIKRSINLSVRDESDFVKTIFQFTAEFINDQSTLNYFGLITTSDASSKITYDLKKITVSVRLNENAFVENPLNESEKDTLEKFESVFTQVYEKLTSLKSDNEIFTRFTKRIFISIIDIENGNSNEKAAFMLLQSVGFINPSLIWAVLIKNCLYYASERLSIDKAKLKNILERYLLNENSKNQIEEEDDELFKTNVILQGEYPVGKEVLLIESFVDTLDYMIVELYRFTDDCSIKSTFYENKIQITNDISWTVIQRFATISGLERFLEENKDLYSSKRIAIIPANDIDAVEKDECSKLHKALIANLFKENKQPLKCIHCGKAINTNDGLLIEVEDRDTPPAAGNIHLTCLRPIDRILGKSIRKSEEKREHLKNFDFRLWVKLLLKGQGMLNSLKSSPQTSHDHSPIIAWKADAEYDTDYSYCIKIILEDSSTSYVSDRGKIERLNMPQAQDYIEFFNERQTEMKNINDPFCVSSISKTFGPYSELIKLKKTEESVLEIESFEISKYSKLIAKAFDKDIFFYAPMCLLRDKATETIIKLSNVVPIISDPLTVENMLQNWKRLGFEFDPVELKIIKSDKDFDNYMRMIFVDKYSPIIDPEFDLNFNLIKGYPIQEYNRLIAMEERKKRKGSK